ncbi:hypothetical protein CAI21_01710 [Alkalilimnicola ehrlichii]|uniref:Secretion protein HlyD family protein n=1 Tax=Alkalilimnicola ehrlichii TaxID=351052 RepID=A0A3E0X169_9GAMM|nr:HlyD family secretion protein [Alkalilimnicola ehrlichii]RFA31365.1 hypothetical protein CAI21_01710 [Alkalilimnicola ehrlichii]RFA39361.1 hypothetical protein CAL65_00695 [Alkalilimnicola ehrlichii]
MSEQEPVTRRRLGRRGKLIIAIVLSLPLIGYGAHWGYQRMTHVHTLDAQVEAGMITLSSRVPGWVTELALVRGDRVEQGQVLALLDARDAKLKLEALVARQAALAAEIEELDARIQLVAAQAASRYARAQARLEVLEAERATRAARLRQAEREHARIQPMANDGLISAQSLDEAVDRLTEAREGFRRAEAELRAAQADIDEAEASLLEPETLQRRRQVLSARLQELDAERRRQALEVEDRVIRSPIDGVIDKVFVEPGEYVASGQNLIMLHSPGQVWVEARVKETHLAPVREGQPVRIRVDAFPGQRFSGRVERVASAATNQFALLPNPNPSGNFTKITQRIPVRIAFDEPDERLAPGMMVEVYIDVRR